MRVLVAAPRYSEEVHADAGVAWLHALRDDSPHESSHIQAGGSLLPSTFNLLWAEALDGFEQGRYDAFAMIHSDPAITRKTIRRPKASASTLLALSGPVVMLDRRPQLSAALKAANQHKAPTIVARHERLRRDDHSRPPRTPPTTQVICA